MSEAGADFDALAAEFFSVWFRYHPDRATEAGVGGYEHLLPAHSDDDLAALGAWLETLVVALEELDFEALDADRRLDLQLMFGAARVEHQELLPRDWRHRDPLRFLPVKSVYRLTVRPPANVREAMAGLLGGVPEHLRHALTHLRSMAELIPTILVDAAVEGIENGRCYLRALVRSPWLRRKCYGWSEIEGLIDGACAALAGFGEALRAEIRPRAAGALGCGEEHLRFLLRQRHFVEVDPSVARGVLEDALARGDSALADHCAEMGLSVRQAWSHLQSQRIDGVGRLDAYRHEADRIDTFLHRSGLLSLPRAPLRIGELHACPSPPGLPVDYIPDRAGGGTFYLGVAGERGVESRALLRDRCLERTWGGAHLLAFASGDAGWRLPRRLCAGEVLAAAWVLYLRERLAELGFLGREDRLLTLVRRGAAIRRALLDLDLHMGALDAASARERLVAIPGAGPADLVAIVRYPGSALAGVLGWKALCEGRAEAKAREGAAFRDRRFHDRLLSFGSIPVPLILQSMRAKVRDRSYPVSEAELGTV